MDTFIGDHHRLPTQEEFYAADHFAKARFVLLDCSSLYAARKGARAETDYMVGGWGSDWFYYYKSWDHSFLEGSDEHL